MRNTWKILHLAEEATGQSNTLSLYYFEGYGYFQFKFIFVSLLIFVHFYLLLLIFVRAPFKMFLPCWKLFLAIASSEFCHRASFLIGNAFLYHIVHSTSQPILLLVIVIFQFHLLEYFLQCHQLHILRCPNCDFNVGAILLFFLLFIIIRIIAAPPHCPVCLSRWWFLCCCQNALPG